MGKIKKILNSKWTFAAAGVLCLGMAVSRFLKYELCEDAVYQPQNISSIEQVIKEQRDFLEKVPPFKAGSFQSEQKAVEIFKTQIKSKLENFLEIPETKTPPIHSDFPDPMNLFFACAYGAMGLLMAYEALKKLKKPSQEMKRTGMHIIPFFGCSLLSVYFFLNIPGFISDNSYNGISKAVSISYDNNEFFKIDTPEKLSMALTHEITHYLQDKYHFKNNSTLSEGHAIGVARNLGRMLYKETGNPDFLAVQKAEQRYFVSVYLEMCKKFGVKPNKDLIKGIEPVNIGGHSLGAALFALKEAQFGDKIYRDVLRGDYSELFGSSENGNNQK
ncbi:hypothetical protein HZA97_01865 [Candidatus Woesearchaeota archaeon]|nr:hypothetical protein [Candidatus Woesearchaeota archaeon]